MTDSNEPTWWRGFHAGFAQLIENHQDDVFAVARAPVIDPGLAEDVAQETFITAFTHRDRLREPAAVGGWLVAIARNLGRDCSAHASANAWSRCRRTRSRARLTRRAGMSIAPRCAGTSGTLKGPSNFLGVDRKRLDVGALLLERTNGDYDGLPWVQVGLGW